MSFRSTLALLVVLAGCAHAPPRVWNPEPPNVNHVPAPGEVVKTYTEYQLHQTAVHEAAHAVATSAYHGAAAVVSIDIHVRHPDGSLHDHVGAVTHDYRALARPQDVLPSIVISRIGIIAECTLAPVSDGGGDTDLENATEAAWRLYAHAPWRRDRTTYDPETAPRQIHEKVALEVEAGDRCAEKMIAANRQLILDLATFIRVRPTVNGIRSVTHDEFVRFMNGRLVAAPCP